MNTCFICEGKMEKKILLNHLKYVHFLKENDNYTCADCQRFYSDRKTFRNHVFSKSCQLGNKDLLMTSKVQNSSENYTIN